MDVKFRVANFNDLEAIINLCNECFEEKTDLKYAEEVYQKYVNDPNQIYIVGVVDDLIVAHTKITIIPTIYEKMNTYAILNHVCVKNEYRRYGIGSKMLKYCEEIAKNNHCVAMELWSMNFRVPAHECYKKYGFLVNDAKFFSKEIN